MLEKDIERHLVAEVRKRGGEAYKFVSPAQRGVADRIVVMPGRVWFVELKRPGGKLTPLQERFRDRMLQLLQNHVVLSSRAEVDQWLTCL